MTLTLPFAVGHGGGKAVGPCDGPRDLSSSHADAVEETFYRLGACAFSIRGRGGLADHVRAECRFLAVAEIGETDIVFDFRSKLPPLESYSLATPVKVSDRCYEAEWGRVTYRVRPTPRGFHVSMANEVKRRHGVPDPLRRFHDWNFQTPEENAAKDFVYGVLGYLTQLVNIGRGSSYLHASSFERMGQGIALIAWRGIGKTAAMLKLVAEHRWKYLSDDLVVIGPPRALSRSAQRIQLYAYNLADENALVRRIFANRSYWDRWAWEFRKQRHGAAGVRRRIEAEELFGAEAISSGAPLVHPILMERADVPDFTRAAMSAAELARCSAHMLLRELDPFVEVATAVNTLNPELGLTTPDIFLGKTTALLEERFRGLEPIRVRIPIDAAPVALAAYLEALVG